MGNILRHVCYFWIIFYGKYVEKICPNWRWHYSASRAPVKSKFDGLKSRKPCFSWFCEFGDPWKPLFVDLTMSKYFKKLRKKPKNMLEAYYLSSRMCSFEDFEMWEPWLFDFLHFEILKRWRLDILKISSFETFENFES